MNVKQLLILGLIAGISVTGLQARDKKPKNAAQENVELADETKKAAKATKTQVENLESNVDNLKAEKEELKKEKKELKEENAALKDQWTADEYKSAVDVWEKREADHWTTRAEAAQMFLDRAGYNFFSKVGYNVWYSRFFEFFRKHPGYTAMASFTAGVLAKYGYDQLKDAVEENFDDELVVAVDNAGNVRGEFKY